MAKNSLKLPLVSIVTVSYKDDQYLAGMLTSIGQLNYPKQSLEVIVVSILGSGRRIDLKDIPIKQIQIPHRVGYAQAVNMGISKSSGQYLFLPNPDTLVEKSGLTKMVTYLQQHRDVGIVGPRVFSMDDPSKISLYDLPIRDFNQATGRIWQVNADEVAAISHPQQFYWVCGNGILVKKAVWQQAKKYDESYFLYWEDADFSMKVRRLGYKSVMMPDAILFHKGSASVGDTPDQVYYIVRNGRYFYNKYCSFYGRGLLHLNSLLVIIAKSWQRLFIKPDDLRTQAFIEGLVDFYRQRRGCRQLTAP